MRTKKKSLILLPASGDGWQVWAYRGGGSCDLTQTVATPGSARAGQSSLVFGVPSTHCRTLAMILPTTDRKVMRNMVFSQLEKRGLTATDPAATVFEPHAVRGDNGDTLVSVDVLADELPDEFPVGQAAAYSAVPRLFLLPDRKLVLFRENGRLVLAIGYRGRLLHSHVLSNEGELTAEIAREIKVVRLSLEAEALVSDIDGVEVWGDFPEEEIATLSRSVDLPVTAVARPSPMLQDGSVLRAGSLLPGNVRALRKQRRRFLFKVLIGVALALIYGLFLFTKRRSLEQFEARATALEPEVAATRTGAAEVKRAGERWRSLRLVLEPKRYPLMHLNHIARIMPPGGVVLRDFESKVSEVKLEGKARSAKDAFQFLKNLNADKDLSVYAWSMPPPAVDDDGSATFEIKGKMR